MPASPKLLLKPFLYVLCCILQICNFSLHHLEINVLCYLEGILFHVHTHITELDISGDHLHGGRRPIFRDACSTLLFIIQHFRIRLLIFGSHSEVSKYYDKVYLNLRVEFIVKKRIRILWILRFARRVINLKSREWIKGWRYGLGDEEWEE